MKRMLDQLLLLGVRRERLDAVDPPLSSSIRVIRLVQATPRS
jgi:hypothetical protein